MENETKQSNNTLSTPLAIVIAGALIAGALYMGQTNGSQLAKNAEDKPLAAQNVEADESALLDKVAPITNEDHILGSPDAPVKIIGFSDFECPFCKRFHDTMNQAMNEYGKDGKVAWVFRQLPLQIHPKNAYTAALASECVVNQKGNEGFWKFADAYFAATLGNDKSDLKVMLPQIYKTLSINQTEIEKCISDKKYDAEIQADMADATATGGRGTPWSIVIAPNGKKFPVSGALPYESLKQIIEMALQEK
jgi:protein-disulfide isomerase